MTLLIPIRNEHSVRVDIPTEDGVGEFLVVGLQLIHTHLRPFGNETAFHLGHRTHHGEEEATHRRRCVNRLAVYVDDVEGDVCILQLVHGGEHVADKTEHAVELHRDEMRILTRHEFLLEFAANWPIPNRDSTTDSSLDEDVDFIKGQALEFRIFLDSSHLCGYAHADVRLSL